MGRKILGVILLVLAGIGLKYAMEKNRYITVPIKKNDTQDINN